MPASGRFLLDTNVVIALLEGDEGVLSKLDLASEVFMSAIVVGCFSEPRNRPPGREHGQSGAICGWQVHSSV